MKSPISIVSLLLAGVLYACARSQSIPPTSATLTLETLTAVPVKATVRLNETPNPATVAAATAILSTITPAARGATPTLLPHTNIGLWTITFERKGGFAGVNQTMSLDSTGRAIVEDVQTRVRLSVQVPQSDVDMVNALLDQSRFFSQPASQNQPCADCYEYALTLIRGEASHIVYTNDMGLDTELRPLVAKLSEMLDAILASR